MPIISHCPFVIPWNVCAKIRTKQKNGRPKLFPAIKQKPNRKLILSTLWLSSGSGSQSGRVFANTPTRLTALIFPCLRITCTLYTSLWDLLNPILDLFTSFYRARYVLLAPLSTLYYPVKFAFQGGVRLHTHPNTRVLTHTRIRSKFIYDQ